MAVDVRAAQASYHNLNPNCPDDIPFYIERLPSTVSRVLKLGCGTGRVSIPLAGRCTYLHGLDLSKAMLRLCRSKLEVAGLGEGRIVVETSDITDFDLGATFDLIIAPCRVVQNLETDGQLARLFRCIRPHLAPDGRCILNAFNPNRPPDTLCTNWISDREHLDWEVQHGGQRVTCHHVRRRVNKDPLILYPDLIYRRYGGADLLDEVVLSIQLRCHCRAEFLDLIQSEGFEALEKRGGYKGEEYGLGKANERALHSALIELTQRNWECCVALETIKDRWTRSVTRS